MKKVLIANRGEIALRIIRSVRDMGFSPIAVYSEADTGSPHLAQADQAFYLGPGPSQQSYLNQDRILEVVERSQADLLHPGYGFLSENASFARALEKTTCHWIGPKPDHIALMGDKIQSRLQAKQSGLPLLEGSEKLSSAPQAAQLAKGFGYPILLKASAGGGGKGMRRVDSENDLEKSLQMAESEAQSAFGDPSVYMEKCLLQPRHVEIQVFGKSNGEVLIVGSRDCSIQRRHQKIVEEAPAPFIPEAVRDAMQDAAAKLCQDIGYLGAGTVEFLLDQSHQFYFLEMNTRLQVEHPVSELIYGIDLVVWQIQTALKDDAAIQLPTPKGHALEVRLYAEDPEQNYLPCPGKINHINWPLGPGVRVDSGVEAHSEVSSFYDPMIAKLIVWGPTRASAIARMQRALRETKISGITSNLYLLKKIIADPIFGKGPLATDFLDHLAPSSVSSDATKYEAAALAAAILNETPADANTHTNAINDTPPISAWWKRGLGS